MTSRKEVCPKGHAKTGDNLRIKKRISHKYGPEYEYVEYRCRICDNYYKHKKREDDKYLPHYQT